MPEIISRAEAEARGLKRYFTGLKCFHGHVSERYVSHRGCIACQAQRPINIDAKNKRMERHKDERNARLRAARAADPERFRATARRYRAKNRDEINANARAKKAENPEKSRAAQKRYYARHKEEIRERWKKSYYGNLERRREIGREKWKTETGRERQKKYRSIANEKRRIRVAKDREKRRAYCREYYRRQREKILASNRQWRERNSEKLRAYRERNADREALREKQPKVRAKRIESKRKRYYNGPLNPKGELQWLRKNQAQLRNVRRLLRRLSHGLHPSLS